MHLTSNIAVLYHRWSLKAFEVVSTRVILLWMISRSQLVARDWVGHVYLVWLHSFVLITRILADRASLLECRTSTKRLVLNLKVSRHFVILSEETPKAIVSRSYMFSRALHQFQANSSSFDWFSGLPISFMIGQSWFYNTSTQLKTTLDTVNAQQLPRFTTWRLIFWLIWLFLSFSPILCASCQRFDASRGSRGSLLPRSLGTSLSWRVESIRFLSGLQGAGI